MRNRLFLQLLSPLLVLAVLVLVASASSSQAASPKPVTIAVPAKLGPSVLEDRSLYALAGDRALVRIDLENHRTYTVVHLPTGQTPQMLAVSGGRACVAARDEQGGMHLHVIDLGHARVTRTIDQAPAAIRGLGFASDGLLYAVDGRSVQTIEVATGKTRHTVEVKGGVLMGSHRVGDRLYVAREYAGGLAIVDLKEGKLLDLIPTSDWLFQVQVIRDTAFVWGSFHGVGRIDLKTRHYRSLKQPEPDNAHHRYTILAGPEDQLLVVGQKGLYRYDAQGNQVASTPLPGKAPHTLAGLWQGRAVLVGKDGVTLVGLAKPAAGHPQRLSVRLQFSATEYDPSQPSPATLKCVVHNEGEQAVQVPVGYDGGDVVVRSGLLTLQPAPESKGQEGGQVKDGVDLVRLEPGKEQVVFDLPLDSIFRVSDPPDRAWYWDWPRRPEPPRSPIHRYRRPGFVAQARFTASLAVGGQMVNSNEAVLKVKSGR